jgi:hypothetical protein
MFQEYIENKKSQTASTTNLSINELTRRFSYFYYKLIKETPSAGKRIFSITNQAISFWRNGRVLYKSQFTLAKEYGVCNDTISRDMEALEALGIIEVKHRFDNSNVYLLSTYCFIPEILELFIKWFPALDVLLMTDVELSKSSHGYSNNKEEDCPFTKARYGSILWLRKWKPIEQEIEEGWSFFCNGKEYIPPEGDLKEAYV